MSDERLEHENRQLREQLASLQRRHANLIERQEHYGLSRRDMEARLDAMLWVWCSGGCKSGVLRWINVHDYGDRNVAFSKEVVQHAINNTQRLVAHWRNEQFRPIYQKFVAQGLPWKEAYEAAKKKMESLHGDLRYAASKPTTGGGGADREGE